MDGLDPPLGSNIVSNKVCGISLLFESPRSTLNIAFAFYHCDNLSEMLKGLVKATVPVVKLGVKVGLGGGAVYVTKEVAANFLK